MRTSSKIRELRPAQLAALPAYRDRWRAVAFSTEAVNERRVTRALAVLYEIIGLDAPKVVMTRSPFDARRAHGEVANEAGAPVSEKLRAAATSEKLNNLSPNVRKTMAEHLVQPIGRAIERSLMRPIVRQITDPPGAIRRSVIGAQRDAGDAAFYDFACHELGLVRQTEDAMRLAEVSLEAGWVMACRNMCFVANRPHRIVLDDAGRLHAEDRAALVMRDGRRIFAWHGIYVPGDVIMRPQDIDARRIDAERNAEVRRCTIERLGLEAYFAQTRARLVAEDETGRLWLKEFGAMDQMAVVEVVNGSLEPDGTRRRYFLRVPPDCRTARQAVAWTYGLSEDEYQLMVRT